MGKIGRLDQKITILRNTGTLNSAGEKARSWVAQTPSVWAEDMTVAARETVRAGAATDAPEHVFRMRNDSTTAAITNRDRLRWDSNGSTVLVVLGVARMGGRDMYLRITARTLSPGEA